MRVYAILFLTMLRRSAFTLIEILIAVGMIAALATVVVVILNPAELAAQARDARRLTETSGLKQAITLISPKDWDGPNYQDSCAGEATPRIFVSVPSDNGEIPPALPPGWTSYVQVPRAASRAVDGTGWVPLDFRVAGDVGTTLPLGVLPVDPINTFASGYYYTYVCGANSYELSVGLQSSKFQKVMSEGGDDPAAFETGGSLSLAPPRSTVSCSASPPAVDIGENVTATGSGGNGTYSWAAPDGTPASGSGPTFLTSYNTTGTKAITVTSAGVNNVCPVAVSEGGVPLPAFDFTLTNNGNRTVSQGSSALETITAILASGTSEPVSFTASGLPLGASSSFSPTSCNPTCTSFLTLTAAATTPMGDSTVVVTGAAGSVTRTTNFTLTVTAPPADTQAPTVPTNLTATAISSSQINLSWTASTDNVGVSGYRVYRGGVQIATTTATTYQNTGLAPSTTYTYTVSAYDAAKNASAQSASASATTQAGGAAGAFIVDHTNLYLFDQIPEQYIVAAQNTPMMWVDRSVGANINEGLNCLEYESDELAPNSCKRNGTAPYDSPASELNWYRPGGYDRSNWVFYYIPGQGVTPEMTCPTASNNGMWDGMIACFIEFATNNINIYDASSYQHSYLDVAQGSSITNPTTGYFVDRSGNIADIYDYEQLEASFSNKKFIYWTTSLARGIGSQESTDYNDQMRQFAQSRGKILFDVADIEFYDPYGNPCYDNRDGVENPDDGFSYPAICKHYTTETNGGHLGNMSVGKIRIAKGFWITMAYIAGWRL